MSSETYETKAAALNGIESVRRSAGDESRFVVSTNKIGEPYFLLMAGNGEVIGKSETFSSIPALENGIESVKKNAPDAFVEDF